MKRIVILTLAALVIAGLGFLGGWEYRRIEVKHDLTGALSTASKEVRKELTQSAKKEAGNERPGDDRRSCRGITAAPTNDCAYDHMEEARLEQRARRRGWTAAQEQELINDLETETTPPLTSDDVGCASEYILEHYVPSQTRDEPVASTIHAATTTACQIPAT